VLLRRAREADPTFPRVVFVHPATETDGEAFFRERWPEVPAIADDEHALYDAFGLRRGSLMQLLGPKVWLAGLRALGAGHGVGRPKGDTLLLAGGFLVREGRVVWSHYSTHTGDIIEPGAVPRA
jgi:hypothetical protein